MQDLTVINNEDQILECNVSRIADITINSLPLSKFPRTLKTACRKNEVPEPNDLRTLISILAKFQISKLKSDEISVSRKIAKCLTDTYPESFADRIHNQIVGDGIEKLTKRLNQRIQIQKK